MQISGSGPRQARAGPCRRRDAARAGACRDHIFQMSAGRALGWSRWPPCRPTRPGSARRPNLVRGVGGAHWQVTIVVTSVLALVAALVVSPVRAGPGAAASPPLDIWAAARAIRRERPLGLVTMGYLGHMWELYALWAWLALFFAAARQAATGMVPSVAETGPVTFLAIGVAGLAGAVVAGRLADRIGRTTVTTGAMLLSGAIGLASPISSWHGGPSSPLISGRMPCPDCVTASRSLCLRSRCWRRTISLPDDLAGSYGGALSGIFVKSHYSELQPTRVRRNLDRREYFIEPCREGCSRKPGCGSRINVSRKFQRNEESIEALLLPYCCRARIVQYSLVLGRQPKISPRVRPAITGSRSRSLRVEPRAYVRAPSAEWFAARSSSSRN
jgi:hypothetical protein